MVLFSGVWYSLFTFGGFRRLRLPILGDCGVGDCVVLGGMVGVLVWF